MKELESILEDVKVVAGFALIVGLLVGFWELALMLVNYLWVSL